MAGKIFCRERRKIGEGEKRPLYRIVAVADVDVKVYASHLRKMELQQIAQAVGAEVVFLGVEKGSGKGKAQ